MEKTFLIFLLFDALIGCLLFKKVKNRLCIIPALVALGTAGYQAYQGWQQNRKAKKLKQSNFVPAATEEALSNARTQISASSPGYTRGTQKLKQSSASTLANAKKIGGSATQLQQVVADTDAREKETLKDLEVSDQAFKSTSRDELNRQLATKSRYQAESFDALNASKSALIGASKQNQFNAITGLAEGIVNSVPDSAIAGTGKGKAGKVAGQKMGGTMYDPESLTDGQIQELYRRMKIGKQNTFMTGY